MSKGRVLVDMDGVLADFEGEFARRWQERWPDDNFEKYQQRDQFKPDSDKVGIENLQAKFFEIYTEPGLFEAFEPLADGKGLVAIRKLDRAGYDVAIVTSAGTLTHAFSEKANWIKTHLGNEWVEKLVVTRVKHFVSGDVLIDDRPDAARGKDTMWQQIIYDQPYNQHVTDCPRLDWDADDWQETIENAVAQVQSDR